jgi:hypothetical protein
MNERIAELMRSKGLHKNISEDCQHRMEMLAELIVQECMACSTWVGKMNTNSVEPIHTAHAINQRIKKQLGVEA